MKTETSTEWPGKLLSSGRVHETETLYGLTWANIIIIAIIIRTYKSKIKTRKLNVEVSITLKSSDRSSIFLSAEPKTRCLGLSSAILGRINWQWLGVEIVANHPTMNWFWSLVPGQFSTTSQLFLLLPLFVVGQLNGSMGEIDFAIIFMPMETSWVASQDKTSCSGKTSRRGPTW